MSVLDASELEAGDQCFVFGCTGHLKTKDNGKLVCNKCGQEIGGDDDERHDT